MIAPLTLAERLASSRLMEAHKAIVATLAPLFPGVQVVRHPGRVDVADLVEKEIFSAPTIAVAATRVRVARELAGEHGLAVEWTAYLVVEDKVVGNRRVERDEIAHALGAGLLAVLEDHEAPRWGLEDITDPADEPRPELRPVFTVKALERGVALFAVIWSQTLLSLGEAFWDFTSPPPPDFDPRVYLPGDPPPPEEAP